MSVSSGFGVGVGGLALGGCCADMQSEKDKTKRNVTQNFENMASPTGLEADAPQLLESNITILGEQ
jgi:hypothetical protein